MAYSHRAGPGYGSQQANTAGFGGGFIRAPRGPPPGADPRLWKWFSSVDLDNSGMISPPELQNALVNGDWTPFDLDTVKLLMAMFDGDRSGTIGFNEFAGIWKYIQDWQNVFRQFDRDNSGSIDTRELHDAMRQFGFNLTPQVLELVQKKYDVKASAPPTAGFGGPLPGINFDRFIRACVVVKQLTEAFHKLDTTRSGWIQINYDTFMQTALQLP